MKYKLFKQSFLSAMVTFGMMANVCAPIYGEEIQEDVVETEEIVEDTVVEEEPVVEEEIMEEEPVIEEEIIQEVSDSVYNGFTYHSEQDGIYISSYDASYSTDMVIPSSIDGTAVVGIDDNAFKNNSSITSVTIPESISSLGDGSFEGLVNLTTINYNAINATNQNVGAGLFRYAGQNTNGCAFICGNSVESIPEYITGDNDRTLSHITSISISNSVKSIGRYAFYGANIQTLTLPEHLESVASYAFIWAYNLKEINLYTNGGVFNDSVFDSAGINTDGLVINIKSTVKTIPQYFMRIMATQSAVQPNLKEINVSSSVEVIQEFTFTNVHDFNMNFSGKAPSIAYRAFEGSEFNCLYLEENESYFTNYMPSDSFNRATLHWYKIGNDNGVEIDRTLSNVYTSPNYPNNYGNSLTESVTGRSYSFENASYIEVTFSSDSRTEKNYDYVYIKNQDGTVLHQLTGTEMANQTYRIEGNYVYLYFTSDSSGTFNGVSASIVPYTLDSHPEAYVKGYNLSLSGDIQMNFFVDSSKVSNIQSNVHAQIYTEGVNARQSNVDLDVTNSKTVGDHTYYIFSYGVSPKDMTRRIHFILYNGDDVLEEVKYSIDEYASYIIRHPDSYDGRAVHIAQTLLTYGTYAQHYFDTYTSKLPSYMTNLMSEDYSMYQMQISNKNPNMQYIGARLVLANKPSIELYFIGNATLTCNGEALSTHMDGIYTVYEINDIDSIFTMYTITGPGNSILIRYGLKSYFYSAMQTNNLPLQNLCNAMVTYYTSISANG